MWPLLTFINYDYGHNIWALLILTISRSRYTPNMYKGGACPFLIPYMYMCKYIWSNLIHNISILLYTSTSATLFPLSLTATQKSGKPCMYKNITHCRSESYSICYNSTQCYILKTLYICGFSYGLQWILYHSHC